MSRQNEEWQSMRKCSNCGKRVVINYEALLIYNKQQLVTALCPACLEAKKIQITLEQVDGQWKFYQYFPVES